MSVGLVVKPLISGLAYKSSMLFLSAPSAKIFTFSSVNGFISKRTLTTLARRATAGFLRETFRNSRTREKEFYDHEFVPDLRLLKFRITSAASNKIVVRKS